MTSDEIKYITRKKLELSLVTKGHGDSCAKFYARQKLRELIYEAELLFEERTAYVMKTEEGIEVILIGEAVSVKINVVENRKGTDFNMKIETVLSPMDKLSDEWQEVCLLMRCTQKDSFRAGLWQSICSSVNAVEGEDWKFKY
jgi:hypothetical protein